VHHAAAPYLLQHRVALLPAADEHSIERRLLLLWVRLLCVRCLLLR
jgi:hypothetical protein